MVRALPSVIPPKMYRHFALVTVLLTTAIAMFADGENREASAAQVAGHEQQRELERESAVPAAKPTIVRRAATRPSVFAEAGAEFDQSFGAPMDRAMGAAGAFTTEIASEVTQAGYSDSYLASLGAQERDLLLSGLAKEGLLEPDTRESRSAALIAASHVRSGGSSTNY